MPGLVPGIHAVPLNGGRRRGRARQSGKRRTALSRLDADGREKPGHDGKRGFETCGSRGGWTEILAEAAEKQRSRPVTPVVGERGFHVGGLPFCSRTEPARYSDPAMRMRGGCG